MLLSRGAVCPPPTRTLVSHLYVCFVPYWIPERVPPLASLVSALLVVVHLPGARQNPRTASSASRAVDSSRCPCYHLTTILLTSYSRPATFPASLPIGGSVPKQLSPSCLQYFKDVLGRVRTKVYRGYLLSKFPTEVFGKVRYGLDTLPNTPIRFGTNSTPVPDTSVSSLRPQYQHPTLRYVRYALNTGTRQFGYNRGIYRNELVRYHLNT